MESFTKKQLKQYLRGKWDVRIPMIASALRIADADNSGLMRMLAELEAEGWITKSWCNTHAEDEYDPGPTQGEA